MAKTVTLIDAWKAGEITGLMCVGHDTFGHAGENLNEAYFEKHKNCTTVRIDATPKNCVRCGNTARSLFLMHKGQYLCTECDKSKHPAVMRATVK